MEEPQHQKGERWRKTVNENGCFPLFDKSLEFGNLSPNSPNLRRLMDPKNKKEASKNINKIEEEEKHIRGLESNPALAPTRAMVPGAPKLNFTFNEEKTVVSLPIGVNALKVVC
jgi:hypothetical protein